MKRRRRRRKRRVRMRFGREPQRAIATLLH
jgi:hypothetical protein